MNTCPEKQRSGAGSSSVGLGITQRKRMPRIIFPQELEGIAGYTLQCEKQ